MSGVNLDMGASWREALAEEIRQPYFTELLGFVEEEYRTESVFPPADDIFRALRCTPLEEVKVVIIGQDPYHGRGQADGLCFSVPDGTKIPPSLRNIFTEIERDVGTPPPASGDLTRWATQGVLLLNATLTVREGRAASHRRRGWEEFTDAVVRRLNETSNRVFLLWGDAAAKKGKFLDRDRHLVLTSAHPSPLSAYRGFKGNGHFGKANEYLSSLGKDPIAW